jgi:hypothetical protein
MLLGESTRSLLWQGWGLEDRQELGHWAEVGGMNSMARVTEVFSNAAHKYGATLISLLSNCRFWRIFSSFYVSVSHG